MNPNLVATDLFADSPFPKVNWGALVTERQEKTVDDSFEPLSVGQMGVTSQLDSVARPKDPTGRKIVRNGDIVINSRSDRRGASGVSSLEGAVSVVYSVMSPKGEALHSGFAEHLLKSRVFQDTFYLAGVGIVDDLWTTNFSRMSSIRVPLPPLETQRAIADYLDRETTEIDAMSADLDEMEALLTERRKTAITSAFTYRKATAPLWKFAEISPSTPGINGLENGDDVTFIPLEDVWPNQKAVDFRVVPWESSLKSYTHFQSGDVLLPKVTPTVTHGRAMVANVTTALGVATSEIYTLRPYTHTNPEWLALFLTSLTFLDEAGESVFGTGGLKRISTQFVQSFPAPDMNRSEQDTLVENLVQETTQIDAMLADITELRDLLAERRAAIIAAAVTGQIDIPIHEEATHA